jgi:hypothetical protein
MTYYSTMDYCEFKSKLSLTELLRWLVKPRNRVDGGGKCITVVLLEEYTIREIEVIEGDIVRYEIFCINGDYGKHVNFKEVAEYISEVIAPGEYARIVFDGYEEGVYGFLVSSNLVKYIESAPLVGMSVDQYLERYCNNSFMNFRRRKYVYRNKTGTMV